MAVSRPRPSPSTASSTAMTNTTTTTTTEESSSSAPSAVAKSSGGDATSAATAIAEASKSSSAGELVRHDSTNDETANNTTGKDVGGDDAREGRPKDDAAASAVGGAKKDDGDDEAGDGGHSYSSTKSSLAYQQARQDMADGDFEAALGTIESALRETLETVGDDELHDSLAPLYYLYGTTLLYSVEESSDVTNAQAQEATMASGGGAGDVSAAIAAQEAAVQQGEMNAEDTQIAWENLEMARSILDRSVVISDDVDLSAATGPNSDARDRALDLAQIHLRLGDLQKANGNYADALEDYTTCLDIRSRVFVGGFDRKVADCHYSLGMTYLLRASDGKAGGEARTPQPPPNAVAAVAAAAAAPQEEGQKPALTDAEVAECRSNAMRHYLACGRSIGGLIGILCGVEPTSIVGDDMEKDGKKASSTPQTAAAAASSSAAAASASQSDSARVTAESSVALRDIRSRVANLTPVDPSNDADVVADLRELLDEIQETIDSSEESVRVLKDVSKMKAEAEAQAEEEDDRTALAAGVAASLTAAQSQPAGPTTTIGFGPSAASAEAVAKTAVANPPLMVVKKKKRKDPSAATAVGLSNAKVNPEGEGGNGSSNNNDGKRQKEE